MSPARLTVTRVLVVFGLLCGAVASTEAAPSKTTAPPPASSSEAAKAPIAPPGPKPPAAAASTHGTAPATGPRVAARRGRGHF
jgi:hypothetical protein